MLRIYILFLALALSQAVFPQKPYKGDGADDVLRLLPVGAVVGLKLCGVDSKSEWKSLAVNGGLSLVMTAAATYGLKHVVNDNRPDGTDNKAFPSGHASIAFAGARMLDKEYRHVRHGSVSLAYCVATLVSVDRVCRNRHNWDDVLAGAVIGYGMTELGYWLGNKLLLPQQQSLSFSFNGSSVYFAYSF